MPSSVIYGMLYSPQRKTLDIVFREDGTTYRYYDVNAEEWLAFKRAPSKGTYLNATFKSRHPHYRKLEPATSTLTMTLAASVADLVHDVPDENVWGFYENSL